MSRTRSARWLVAWFLRPRRTGWARTVVDVLAAYEQLLAEGCRLEKAPIGIAKVLTHDFGERPGFATFHIFELLF